MCWEVRSWHGGGARREGQHRGQEAGVPSGRCLRGEGRQRGVELGRGGRVGPRQGLGLGLVGAPSIVCSAQLWARQPDVGLLQSAQTQRASEAGRGFTRG